VLDQVAQRRIGQAVLVGPLRVAKDTEKFVGIRGFDGSHGLLQAPAYIPADLPNLPPMRIGRDLEAMILWKHREGFVSARFLQRGLNLFVEDIAEALVEQQREDELFVVPRVDGSPQKHRRAQR
jgi:hypothetical protein